MKSLDRPKSLTLSCLSLVINTTKVRSYKSTNTVIRLKITVGHTTRVHIADGLKQLSHQPSGFLFGVRSKVHQFLQHRTSVNASEVNIWNRVGLLFKYKISLLWGVEGFYEINDAWVVKLRHHGNLSLQQFVLPLVHLLLGDDLDRVFLLISLSG